MICPYCNYVYFRLSVASGIFIFVGTSYYDKKSFRFFLTKLDVVRNGEELEEVSLASKDMEL